MAYITLCMHAYLSVCHATSRHVSKFKNRFVVCVPFRSGTFSHNGKMVRGLAATGNFKAGESCHTRSHAGEQLHSDEAKHKSHDLWFPLFFVSNVGPCFEDLFRVASHLFLQALPRPFSMYASCGQRNGCYASMEDLNVLPTQLGFVVSLA